MVLLSQLDGALAMTLPTDAIAASRDKEEHVQKQRKKYTQQNWRKKTITDINKNNTKNKKEDDTSPQIRGRNYS